MKIWTAELAMLNRMMLSQNAAAGRVPEVHDYFFCYGGEFTYHTFNLPTKLQNFYVIWKNIRNKIIEIKNILVISPTKSV